MWFAKWFGGRVETGDDEPARHSAPPTPTGSIAPDTLVRASRSRKSGGRATNGFDPYNSGAFERRSAWERVNRR